jgi:uncharacterized membrane protein
MWYGGYGSYAGFGLFGMIFNILILIAIVWAISSFIGKKDMGNKDRDHDERISRIENELEHNRQSLEKILRKLE